MCRRSARQSRGWRRGGPRFSSRTIPLWPLARTESCTWRRAACGRRRARPATMRSTPEASFVRADGRPVRVVAGFRERVLGYRLSVTPRPEWTPDEYARAADKKLKRARRLVAAVGRALAEMSRVVRPGGVIRHAVDPYYWRRGCHKRGRVDSRWAYARLSLE